MHACRERTLENVSSRQDEVKKLLLNSGRHKEYTVVLPPTSLTIRDIQKQIPSHYFERSTIRSLLFLLRDLVQLSLTYAVMYTLLLPSAGYLSGIALNFAATFGSREGGAGGVLITLAATAFSWSLHTSLWCIFWFTQGLNMTALWVLAHECGHQAFSASRWLNEVVGMILHTGLLVPYQSWRITHATHHKHTNHLTKDLVFVPVQLEPTPITGPSTGNTSENTTQKDGNGGKYVISRSYEELLEEAPAAVLFGILRMLLFGWPAHLICNAGGQPRLGFASHFNPRAPFFRPADGPGVLAATVSVGLALFILVLSTLRYGALTVFFWYGAPYMCVNAWLVYITYMQHSDVRLPHYTHTEWTFLRGAVAAVDRDYGTLISAWLHHINDSHVVHHLFSMMPHYNAIEVTRRYIGDILGDIYVKDNRPLWKALIHTWRECRYVVPSEGVCIYRS